MKRFGITEDKVRRAEPEYETPKLDILPLSSRNYQLLEEYVDKTEKDPAHKLAMEAISPTKTFYSNSMRSTPIRLKLSPSSQIISSPTTPVMELNSHQLQFRKGKSASHTNFLKVASKTPKRSKSVLGLTHSNKENPSPPSIPSIVLPIILPKLHASKLTPRRDNDDRKSSHSSALNNARRSPIQSFLKRATLKPAVVTVERRDQLTSWNTKTTAESLATTTDITNYVNTAKE